MNRVYLPLGMAAYLFLSCVIGGEDSVPAEEEGRRNPTSRYSLRGNNIVLAPTRYFRIFCGLTGELARVETVDPEFSIPFEMSGNTMQWFTGPPIFVRSGVTLKTANVVSREGYGAGIEGRWRLSGQGFRVQSGTLTAEENAYYSDLFSKPNPFVRYNHVYWFIGPKTISSYVDAESAAYFQALWNGAETTAPDSAFSEKYDIAVTLVDKHTVELRGMRSGETIRINIGDDGDRDYSSDNPDHGTYQYKTIPVACPNEDTPLWYDAFLDENRKR